ncbi:uncharacterized protein LOC112569552 [Pomacea canaliculata]|uniref:uncharacterized protein LOC112569552 n=1 Tax=Pomacea canaliculata TaxID=400727 RepID=UPI000D730D03|nr:uncharacterized protein LOC112569552 [Pomacea canaliculata]XP_025103146.1 uncharacterized protein LOC112569552 [Pomacea canaliculata]XP_025103147.1 uncharacterized protein LOC112569552 [Pomacea canaliculata]XP_025103148.1 uncharacterized protein LOC112569552 [Pomacea canaliculata]
MRRKNSKTYVGRRVDKTKHLRTIGFLKDKIWTSFYTQQIPSIFDNLCRTWFKAIKRTQQDLAYRLLDHFSNLEWLQKFKIYPSYRTFLALQWCRLYSSYFGTKAGKKLNNSFKSKDVQKERPVPNADSGELNKMLLTAVPKPADIFEAGASNFKVEMADPTIEMEDPDASDCSQFTQQELLVEFGYYPMETESRESAGFEVVVPRVPPLVN